MPCKTHTFNQAFPLLPYILLMTNTSSKLLTYYHIINDQLDIPTALIGSLKPLHAAILIFKKYVAILAGLKSEGNIVSS